MHKLYTYIESHVSEIHKLYNSLLIEFCFVFCGQSGNLQHQSSSFGEGTGPIFIQQTHCSGSESSLLDCRRDTIPITYANCNHFHDAGVTCEGTAHCSTLYISISIQIVAYKIYMSVAIRDCHAPLPVSNPLHKKILYDGVFVLPIGRYFS